MSRRAEGLYSRCSSGADTYRRMMGSGLLISLARSSGLIVGEIIGGRRGRVPPILSRGDFGGNKRMLPLPLLELLAAMICALK